MLHLSTRLTAVLPQVVGW